MEIVFDQQGCYLLTPISTNVNNFHRLEVQPQVGEMSYNFAFLVANIDKTKHMPNSHWSGEANMLSKNI